MKSKSNTVKIFLSILPRFAKSFFAVIAVLFLLSACAGITVSVLSDTISGAYKESVQAAAIIADSGVYTEDSVSRFSVMAESYSAAVDKFFDELSETVQASIPANSLIETVYGKLTRLSGKKVTVDRLYTTCMLQNGYLSYAAEKIDLTRYADNLAAFADAAENAGSDFLFVLNPSKADGTSDLFPSGVTNYYNENRQTLLNALDSNEINYICTDDAAKESGIDICSLFFKTDHHWLATSGVWAAGVVAGELNKNYGYSFESSLFELDNYDITVYDNLFYGSQGKKMSYGYMSPEDFQLVTPKFDTSFEFTSDSSTGKLISRTGTYSETLLNMGTLRDDYSVAEDNAYGLYLNGDRPECEIHNLNCDNGKRMIIVKTSLANVVIPILACGDVEYIDVLDLRMYSGNATDYITEKRADTVVVMYGLPYYSLNLTASSCSWNFT